MIRLLKVPTALSIIGRYLWIMLEFLLGIPFVLSIILFVGAWKTYDQGDLWVYLAVFSIALWFISETSLALKSPIPYNAIGSIMALIFIGLSCIHYAFTIIGAIVFYIYDNMGYQEWWNSLSPSEQHAIILERKRQAEIRRQEQIYREEQEKNRQHAEKLQREHQDWLQHQYTMTHNAYGRPLDAQLPQGAKLLQIHVRYQNGTSGIMQKTGIEHEVRAMLDNDPRVASYDIGLLSPSDNGRYPEY